MLPFIIVVEKGDKVIGLVVLIKYLFLGCACTSHLDWVAQHTSFQDLDICHRHGNWVKEKTERFRCIYSIGDSSMDAGRCADE